MGPPDQQLVVTGKDYRYLGSNEINFNLVSFAPKTLQLVGFQSFDVERT